jgi:hypothetical protein
MLRTSVHSSSGTFNGVASGSAVSGSAVFMGSAYQKVAHLSAVLTVLAETSTMTLTAAWQVSNDGSTWLDVTHASQNPAGVALATGTGGADVAVTKVVEAPSTVYGYKFARARVAVGVATGASSDTYTIAYSYRQLTGAEAK